MPEGRSHLLCSWKKYLPCRRQPRRSRAWPVSRIQNPTAYIAFPRPAISPGGGGGGRNRERRRRSDANALVPLEISRKEEGSQGEGEGEERRLGTGPAVLGFALRSTNFTLLPPWQRVNSEMCDVETRRGTVGFFN